MSRSVRWKNPKKERKRERKKKVRLLQPHLIEKALS
jgi:hypothetical protein